MIPIVYIHRGYADYLVSVIQQAVQACDEENVYLLGDEANADCCRNWFPIADYVSENCLRLEKEYVHYSYTEEQYERFCLQRYFLLLRFMEYHGWRDAYLCDSDLLIYEDLSNLSMGQYDAAFSVCEYPVYFGECASPHCSYWKRESLENFTGYILDIYENRRDLIETIYQYHCEHKVLWVSAICDMVWLTGWKQQKVKQGMRFLNMNEPIEMNGESVVWDHNLSVSDNARMGEYAYRRTLHMKKVTFRGESPYLTRSDGKLIRALTLHCQGGKKKYIKLLTDCSNCYLYYLYVNLIDVIKKRILHRI